MQKVGFLRAGQYRDSNWSSSGKTHFYEEHICLEEAIGRLAANLLKLFVTNSAWISTIEVWKLFSEVVKFTSRQSVSILLQTPYDPFGDDRNGNSFPASIYIGFR